MASIWFGFDYINLAPSAIALRCDARRCDAMPCGSVPFASSKSKWNLEMWVSGLRLGCGSLALDIAICNYNNCNFQCNNGDAAASKQTTQHYTQHYTTRSQSKMSRNLSLLIKGPANSDSK